MADLHKISGCDNAKRKGDVVFIHGLGGDPFSTWRYGSDNAKSWPHWVGQEFAGIGVWSLGYAASPSKWGRLLQFIGGGSRNSGHTMPLTDRAAQVLNLMVQNKIGQRPLIFICHSLGGLLAKQILRKSCDSLDENYRRIAEQTRGIQFLATPHTGATLASLLNAFRIVAGATVTIEELRAHDAHLRDLYDWYRSHAPRLGIETVTYFETLSVANILPIVNPSSAHPATGRDPVGLEEDHISIAKPRANSSQVCNAARDLVRSHLSGQGSARTSGANSILIEDVRLGVTLGFTLGRLECIDGSKFPEFKAVEDSIKSEVIDILMTRDSASLAQNLSSDKRLLLESVVKHFFLRNSCIHAAILTGICGQRLSISCSVSDDDTKEVFLNLARSAIMDIGQEMVADKEQFFAELRKLKNFSIGDICTIFIKETA